MTEATRIRPRDRDAILQSLKAGVVPRRGHHHIQVGRAAEVKALVRDTERIADGGAAVRLVIGEYGSGKTFFLHLVRSVAHERGLVTMHADLTPDRRLQSSTGHARSLYAELARNLSTRTKPEGGALRSVVERFVGSARQDADRRGVAAEAVIRDGLEALSELHGGYDFASVVEAYWKGHDQGDEALKGSAIRWFRGEYTTKTDARRDLGVRSYVEDDRFYDQLKLLARFVTLAGYGGLFVSVDEMVNLYKLSSTRARKRNYEQILRIVNDCLQGGVEHLGFAMGGTPEFLMDTRKGLYSYEALQSRLAENVFVVDGDLRDLSGPVIRLPNLTPEELYVLLKNLRHVHAHGNPDDYLLPDEALEAFLRHCNERIGARYFQTPRNTIKAFVQLLAILEQNPGTTWRDLLANVEVEEDRNPDLEPLPEKDDVSSGDSDSKVDAGPDTEAEDTSGGDDDLAEFRL